MVDSSIKWHGGKHYLAPKMLPYLPPHKLRVYGYAGGINELFAWPYDGVSEIINDIDGELTNFWHVLQDEKLFLSFERIVQAIPVSQEEFKIATTRREPSTDEVRRALDFFVKVRQSRQALGKDFATMSKTRVRRGMNETASAWLTSIEGLRDVHTRLKRVVVFNQPALRVIAQQDSPDTFFYLDPTYLPETRTAKKAYKFEMTPEDHEQLLALLAQIEGKFMLSCYPSEMYDKAEAENGWCHVDFDLPNNASSKAEKDRKIERIVMNYTIGSKT